MERGHRGRRAKPNAYDCRALTSVYNRTARQMDRVWRWALNVMGEWEVVTIMATGPVDTEPATSAADHCPEASTHQQLALSVAQHHAVP